MADCSQFLVNYWAGEKIVSSRYIDLVSQQQEELKEVDAGEIVERIKDKVNKVGEHYGHDSV